jgi:CCR4-NOT transcription complex subunit 2
MVKQPAMEEREFQMSNEDFPALPGVPGPNPASMASAVAGPTSAVPMDQSEVVVSSMGPPIQQLQPNLGHDPMASMSSAAVAASMAAAAAAAASIPIGGDAAQLQQQQQQLQQQRRGIQTSPTGLVTNIPNSMVTDQFGMIGLLTFIRAAETDPNLVSLALGADLTTLGLNLNSEVNLYPTFGGPWADTPCRPQDIDYHVPYEYLTNTTIR